MALLKEAIEDEKKKGQDAVKAREDWWKAEMARVAEDAAQQVTKVLGDNEDTKKEIQL